MRQLSPKTGGVIKACYVKVGDVVRKGDPILTLHDEKEAAAVVLARTQLEVAQAEEAQVKSGIHPNRIVAAEMTVLRLTEQHKFASQEVERHRNLIDNGGVSRSKLEQDESTKRDLEAAIKHAEAELMHLKTYVRDVDEMLMKAKVGQAAANLALAEQHQRDLCVLAPFDGTVLKLLKRPGEGVRMIELEPVVLFGDLSRLRVRAEIDERFVKDRMLARTRKCVGEICWGKANPGKWLRWRKSWGTRRYSQGHPPTRSLSEKSLRELQCSLLNRPF